MSAWGDMMTIKQLDYFMETARQLSFSKAAENLFISQSRIVIGKAATTDINQADRIARKCLSRSFWKRRIIIPPEISIVAATVQSDKKVENRENSP